MATSQRPRGVAAELGVPAGTVRDWLRRLAPRAEALRCEATDRCMALDSALLPTRPAGPPLGNALDALAAAVHAARAALRIPAVDARPAARHARPARHLAAARSG